MNISALKKLRNECTTLESQNSTLKTNIHLEIIPLLESADLELVKVAIQTISNLCTSNPHAQSVILPLICPHVPRLLTQADEICSSTLIAIYNSTFQSKQSCQILLNNASIITKLLDPEFICDADLRWAILTNLEAFGDVDLILSKNPNFIQILIEMDQVSVASLSSTASIFIKMFEKHSPFNVSKSNWQKPGDINVGFVVAVEKLFASHLPKLDSIQRLDMVRMGLLESFLKLLHWADVIQPRSTLSNPVETMHPLLCVKRDAIKCISSLCFESRTAQDIVRELGYLPIIISQCRDDEFNPCLFHFLLMQISENTELFV